MNNYREVLHRLNQRYFHEWQRAELLAQQLAGRSWWARLRRWWGRPRPLRGEQPLTAGPVPAGRVSLIIPFRDQFPLLRSCLRSLRGTRRRLETILVDNGSREPPLLAYLAKSRHRVIPCNEPFNFARLCNLGARQARGEWLLFLNNDIEALHPDWLVAMLRLAALPTIGPVGATLVYPDGSIQHAGLHPNEHGQWVHVHRHRAAHEPALAQDRVVPAVSAACLLIHREKWQALGGFDEAYPVTYNDVDLCVRARLKGWQTAISAQARLIHYESLSRGFKTDTPGQEHLAHWTAFPTGAGAWPASNWTGLDSPSASAANKAD
ncbi:MAG: glycosyltransferase family 2 protein [Gemmataceae bacterium]